MRVEIGGDASLVQLVVRLARSGADGRAGLGALLREVETKYPGERLRLAVLDSKPTGLEIP